MFHSTLLWGFSCSVFPKCTLLLFQAFEQRMLDMTEESKRTKLSFKIMKQANDSLKKQVKLANLQTECH